MGVLRIILRPLQHAFVMIYAIVVIRVVQLPVMQKARLGATAAEIAMAVIHITEAHRAAIMWARAHICVMPLTATQDAVTPFGALFIHMVSAIFLTLAAVEPPLALSSSTIECILIALLLGYTPDGGVVDKGGTNSTMITPCRSSNVAIAGTVVVTSLVTSPNSVINMATIVCSGMCTGGGGRDSARGG
jgi:hypothetical protein